MDYEYDVFVSYCHDTSVKVWVQTHFVPMLEKKLTQELPCVPRIFIDHEMPNGVYWRDRLKRALIHSKLLLCIWNPPYFNSKWCQAEWQTMLLREEHVGVQSHEPGFLYSVVFSDGDFFPDEAGARQCAKFHKFAITARAFVDTPKYMEFEERVADVARDIVQRLQGVPDWEDGWTVAEPEELTLKPLKPLKHRPRL